MQDIRLATKDRKAAAARLAEILGVRSYYTRVPRCAYKVGKYIIEQDGSITFGEGTDLQPLRKLEAEGLVAPFTIQRPQPAPESPASKPAKLTVSLPTTPHTGATLRNLINLVYTRAGLLNKALGTDFWVDRGLTEALQDDACTATVESLLDAVAVYEEAHGKAIRGISITPEEIRFSTLPETADPERLRAFNELVARMNQQALEQNRVRAKTVNDENEKYAFRAWLTRLGMNGPEFKATRKLLLENLSGHCAFRTPASQAQWKARHTGKHEPLESDTAVDVEVDAQ